MEISVLKVLRDSISALFHLSSYDNITHEPAQKYYQKVEEILKLLKPLLDAIFDAGLASEELLQDAFTELAHSVNELGELFTNWHPLRSKIYLVLQVESLISKIQASRVEVFELLKSCDQCLPVELNASSLESQLYARKIKEPGLEKTSAIIIKANMEQVDGSGTSSESLAKIFDCLGLRSNQELLVEAVALEKLKENAEQAEKNSEAKYFDQMIALVTHMHERLVTMKQSESSNPVPIPADFCCPLSLELMTDPVIVASGQTYERAFIRKWIDLGLNVCPKTRQTLARTNFIPNYTVKALIASWCESNIMKLPDPKKSMTSNQSSSLADADITALEDPHLLPHSRSSQLMSPDSTQSTGSPGNNLLSSNGIHLEGISSSHPCSSSEGSLPCMAGTEDGLDIGRLSLNSAEEKLANVREQSLELDSQHPISPSRTELSRASGDDDRLSHGHKRIVSAFNALSGSNISQGMLANGNESTQVTASGELTSYPQVGTTLTTPIQGEPDPPPGLETISRIQTVWRHPSDGFIPRIVSAPEPRASISEVETKVQKLVEDLKSTSLGAQRIAIAELRQLAKDNMENRVVIANCGAISLLVSLLLSTDTQIQENAVTTLLNLSIHDNNKAAIGNANAIEPLIHVLETGSTEAKENSAATLFSLSVIADNKVSIGRSRAITPLVELLGSGTPRGKKDAATALFNLSTLPENKARIVQAGAVKYLVELMDPAAGMVDKAVAVLANLATIPEGKNAIGQEGGIRVLVEVVELGSARGKEHAAAALLHLCSSSNKYCSLALQEEVVPPLMILSQSGTSRGKDKARALLRHLRNQPRGNAGRG